MDDVFEQFDDFTINKYIPKTDDDVISKEIEELVNELGPEHLIDIDGEQVLNPNIKLQPPLLVKQESIGASFVKTLYISETDIATQSSTTRQRVTASINIINNYLGRLGLHWKITFDTIKGKLSKNGNYLRNTLYGIWSLEAGAKLVMTKSLHKNPDEAGSTTVIIDYCNLKGGLSRCRPYREPDEDFADKINNWTMTTYGPTNRIIISIQANNILEPIFIRFKNRLYDIFGRKNIVIIVGSDASSYDDLNIAYIVTKLLPNSNKYIISSDKFRDLHRINPDLTDKNPMCKGWATSGECERNPVFMNENCAASCSTSRIFENKDGPPLLRMIEVEDTFCEDDGLLARRIRPRSSGGPVSRYGVPGPSFSGHGSSSSGPISSLHGHTGKRGRDGGTNKNKKSLLNKYTRKVKKLHKKRILSKKVVKKYNKNYKKKTLKRKHK